MFGAIFCVVAAVAVFVAARWGRGFAIAALVVVGYAYGIARARFLDGASHFSFDAALIALYITELARKRASRKSGTPAITKWVIALSVWPLVCMLYSPIVESQHLLIQLVGLRASVFMIPIALVGARLSRDDIHLIARVVAILNVIALGFAIAEMRFGVAVFFPENAVSQIIYASRDVGEDMYFRIPSTFSSAHAYGGTMLLSLPFLVDLMQDRSKRGGYWLGTIGMLAAVIGVFACAARQPVVQLGVAFIVILLTTRPTAKNLFAFALVAVVAVLIVSSSERFERFLTLSDAEYVQARISGSVNKSFLDVAFEYPLGTGLGSAAGTSIPFFLLQYARPGVGLENEYSRIALEQGLFGLALWLVFLGWLLMPRRSGGGSLSSVGHRFTWAVVVGSWASAVIGTGILTSIPGTAFLMLLAGVMVTPAIQHLDESVPSEERQPSKVVASNAA